MIRLLRSLRPLIAVCALALACGAHAEKADKEKPIAFTSDEGEVNYEKKTGVLKGNVVITQGTLTIKANRIDFRQNADNSLSATAFGSPLSFRQKRDDAEGYYEGWAQRAEYDGTKDQLELFDNAILKRGADEIRSNYISYNSATEQFRAEGRASTAPVAGEPGRSDKVRGVFQPKSDVLPGKGAPGKGSDGKSAPLTLTPSGEIAPAAK
ncbi:MAG: lipopolysaccharide transport periplasmic protein LptA [Burkholderiales bacterium]